MNGQNIKMELSVEEVNIVLNALSSRPYIEVAELIAKIQTEGERQIAQINYVAETTDSGEA